MINVVIKEPGKSAYRKAINTTLETLQYIVGGYIEAVTVFSDLVIICDEEGRLKGRPHNVNICGVDFVGTIVFVGVKDDDFADCPALDCFRSLEVEE